LHSAFRGLHARQPAGTGYHAIAVRWILQKVAVGRLARGPRADRGL